MGGSTQYRVGYLARVLFFGLTVLMGISALGCSKQNTDGNLYVSGTVEATEIVISAEAGGKIREITAEEGTMVQKGTVVARIDSTIQALQVQQAEAALKAAQASSKQTRTGNREELIAQARAGVEQVDALVRGAKESTENAFYNLNRIKALTNDGGATIQQLTEAQTRYETAKAQLEAYQAQRKSAQEQLDLLKNGSTKETINIADANTAQAQVNLAIAKAQLAKSTVISPGKGIISTVNFNEGEFAPPGSPIYTLTDTKDLTIRVYVSEKELPKVKIGQKAEIFVDAYPGEAFHGKVSYISSTSEFTPKNLQTAEERVNMVFAVKVKITDGGDRLKPGLPADVKIIL